MNSFIFASGGHRTKELKISFGFFELFPHLRPDVQPLGEFPYCVPFAGILGVWGVGVTPGKPFFLHFPTPLSAAEF